MKTEIGAEIKVEIKEIGREEVVQDQRIEVQMETVISKNFNEKINLIYG